MDGATDGRPTGGAGAGQQVTLRPRRVMWLSWVGAVAVVVLFVVIAVVLRTADTGVYFRLADQVAMVLLGLLIAGGLLLLARPRVRADAEGIEVRNILLTRRLPWTEVVGIAFPDGASWARLDLPDYEYLPVLAVQAVDRQHAVDGIRRLRALHAAAHRAAAGAAHRPEGEGTGPAGSDLAPGTPAPPRADAPDTPGEARS